MCDDANNFQKWITNDARQQNVAFDLKSTGGKLGLVRIKSDLK